MTKTNKYSNPQLFWENRLSNNFNLIGVGYASLGEKYNSRIYQARVTALERATKSSGVTFFNSDILEIGCGTGFFTNYCQSHRVHSYTGVDITDISISSLRKLYPAFNFIQADVGDKDFLLNEKFDIIFIADVLYHIVDDNRFTAAIEHFSEQLKPAGHLIISDLFTDQTIDSRQHCKWRSINTYHEILTKNGFSITKIEPIFSVLHPPVLVNNSPIQWKIYSLAWRYLLLRMTHIRWFDDQLSNFLSVLDRKYFLRQANINTPNSKWLIAVKNNVG